MEAGGASFENTVLHVGAGTFVPVEGPVADHVMHHEPFSISIALVRRSIAKRPAPRTRACGVGPRGARGYRRLAQQVLNVVRARSEPELVCEWERNDVCHLHLAMKSAL